MNWTYVCETDDVDEEDLISWDHEGHVYAIYNTEEGFFATDGMCTHEVQSLDEGLVVGKVIECPLHGGRFDIPTGKALSAPACVDLKTYQLKIEDDKIYIGL
ncbi:non-heme iron oxygenase ferredoxin subunit [Curvivirga sp.]|uniref:non-heme iron oxygenase ferredoxin subunit n=1 Tax=Curvivirga sp. TaxID=2856848 RepID=UPI003B5CEE7D